MRNLYEKFTRTELFLEGNIQETQTEKGDCFANISTQGSHSETGSIFALHNPENLKSKKWILQKYVMALTVSNNLKLRDGVMTEVRLGTLYQEETEYLSRSELR